MLQLLPLLGMLFLHLLSLLLVPLLDLLSSGFIGILFRQPLVLLLLLLLEFLPLLVLLGEHLVLLLLVFPVAVGVSGVGSGALHRRKVFRVDGCSGTILTARPVAPAIGRRVVRRSRFFGGYGSVKICRPGSSGNGRPAMVGGCMEFRVRASSLKMLLLNGYRWKMPITSGNLVFRPRPRIDTARAAVVTDVIHRDIGDPLFIHVVNVHDVDVGYGTVVEEAVVIPAPAFEAVAEITEAVNNSAIEADTRTPIPVIKKPSTVGPGPIRRRPEETDFRG